MNINSKIIFYTLIIFTFIILIHTSNVSALTEPSEDITVSPIDEKISLEKTITLIQIPDDRTLLWGTLKGKASDYVERYPVIIQFFKGDEPVHVAQVKIKGDGSYEYKFKIRSVDQSTKEIVDIFKGEYTVKIFKVIHNKT